MTVEAAPRRSRLPGTLEIAGKVLLATSKALLLLSLVVWAVGRSSPWSDASPFPMFIAVAWAALIALRRPRSRRSWLLASASVVLATLAFLTPLPIKARFELDRSAFEEVAANVEPTASIEEWRLTHDDFGRIGTYDVRQVHAVGENVVFYSGAGRWFDDAGFAYLPDGPDARLDTGWFERPQFRSLGGGWYQWTASW